MNNEAPARIWLSPVSFSDKTTQPLAYIYDEANHEMQDIEYRRIDPPAAPDERDKALAQEVVVQFNLPSVAKESLAKSIIAALATVRGEVWRDATMIIDDAGQEWGTQARARKSKTYSAYVIAALDLKGRFDESARTGKVEG